MKQIRESDAINLDGKYFALNKKTLAIITEYNALRLEIEWLIKDATQYQNFAIALMGATIPAIAWVLEKSPNLLNPLLLVIPFVFCLLGFLFFRQHEEVYVVAAYLRESVRPQLWNELKDKSLWQWEEFKHKRSNEINNKGIYKYLSSGRMVLILRTSLFLMPSIISIFAMITQVASKGFQKAFYQYHFYISTCLSIMFVLDVLAVFFLLICVCRQGDLPRRALGLASHRNRKK